MPLTIQTFFRGLSTALVFIGVFHPAAVNTADANEGFSTVKAQTFSKKDFRFPDDLAGGRLNIIFLGIAKDQDKGEAQPEVLLEWHAALEAAGAFSNAVMPYHFVVISGPPFFVKGLIRRGLRKTYEDRVPPDQGAVLFVDDIDEFAASGGLVVDDEPYVLIVSAGGQVLASFRGRASDAGVAGIISAINELTGVAEDARENGRPATGPNSLN